LPVEAQFFRLINRLVEPHIRAGWGSPRLVPGGLIVLETTGRRSGRRSRLPLAALRVDGHVIVSTFRGNRSQWVKNAAANPDVRYWLRGRPRQARAFVIASARGARGQNTLPAAVRWLVRSLIPYTYAGWVFAVLAPVTAHERNPVRAPRTAPRSGVRKRNLRFGAGGAAKATLSETASPPPNPPTAGAALPHSKGRVPEAGLSRR
jgi:deazaflavin-dependent oxidoreductase (nitroreductase family)